MTAIEIQQDAIYAEAYKAAENAFNKKYSRLLNAADHFLRSYDSLFGEPEKWDEYSALKKIIDKKKHIK